MLYFSDNAHLGWVRDSATWEDCTKLGGPKRILECVWPEKNYARASHVYLPWR